MGAHPVGANVGGRPRKLDREIERLSEAAAHARALLEQRAIVAAMDDAGCQCRQVEIETAAQHVAQIERHLGMLRALAEPLEEGSRKRRKRRHRNGVPRIHADQYARDVATCAVALDRLLEIKGNA